VDSHLRWIRERATEGTVKVVRRSSTSLAGLVGIRVVVSYRDRKSGQELVEDALEFIRPLRPKIVRPRERYTCVYLRSPQSTYAKDLREFEKILSSIRFTKSMFEII
jgi:hypothetical protein